MNRAMHFLLFLAVVSSSVVSMSVVSMTAVAQNTASPCTQPAWVIENGPGYDLNRHIFNDDHCSATFVRAPASSSSMAPRDTVMNAMAVQEYEPLSTYRELVEPQRLRAAQEAAIGSGEYWYGSQRYEDPEPRIHANPDAPDQSELLKNSHDRDFILRNFRTMYIETQARYFGRAQMIAALGKNPNFEKLNIRIVDEPSVADAVLSVSYTFAWDFPFKLRHQNTTIVLVSGKGEGPFSGPLGAADVARQFVKSVEEWRTVKDKSNH